MISEIYSRCEKGRVLLFKEPYPDTVYNYVVWEDVTVGLWKKVLAGKLESEINPYLLERQIWKYLVQDSNLCPIERTSQGLTNSTLETIMKFKPGILPKSLIKPLFNSIYLTNYEVEELNRQCSIVFRNESRLKNPHPLMEEALLGTVMKERYGIPLYKSLEEMPQKVYLALRLIASNYNEIANQQSKSDDLRLKAMKLAGLRK